MAEGNAPVKHIFYADEKTPICADRILIPDNPIRFPTYEGSACVMCYMRFTRWTAWWLDQGAPYKKEN